MAKQLVEFSRIPRHGNPHAAQQVSFYAVVVEPVALTGVFQFIGEVIQSIHETRQVIYQLYQFLVPVSRFKWWIWSLITS